MGNANNTEVQHSNPQLLVKTKHEAEDEETLAIYQHQGCKRIRDIHLQSVDDNIMPIRNYSIAQHPTKRIFYISGGNLPDNSISKSIWQVSLENENIQITHLADLPSSTENLCSLAHHDQDGDVLFITSRTSTACYKFLISQARFGDVIAPPEPVEKLFSVDGQLYATTTDALLQLSGNTWNTIISDAPNGFWNFLGQNAFVYNPNDRTLQKCDVSTGDVTEISTPETDMLKYIQTTFIVRNNLYLVGIHRTKNEAVTVLELKLGSDNAIIAGYFDKGIQHEIYVLN